MLSPSHNEDADDSDNDNEQHSSHDMPSKFLLYQQSVQVSLLS